MSVVASRNVQAASRSGHACAGEPAVPRSRPFVRRTARAFTLIELLIVVGLIALVAAGFGFALGDAGGNSLSSAQTTLLTLLNQTRAQAAVHQTHARLYIYAVRPPLGDAGKYLRLLQVFSEDLPDSGRFFSAGPAVNLPRGIYVVPSSTTGLLASGVIWPANPEPVSTFTPAQPTAVNPTPPVGTPFGGDAVGYYIEFTPNGTPYPATSPYAKLVIATAAQLNGLPQFNNPGAVRGVAIRPSGAITAINDANSF
jgi:prepilin-type N-terminal cleavage/methylation domain-containing protein